MLVRSDHLQEIVKFWELWSQLDSSNPRCLPTCLAGSVLWGYPPMSCPQYPPFVGDFRRGRSPRWGCGDGIGRVVPPPCAACKRRSESVVADNVCLAKRSGHNNVELDSSQAVSGMSRHQREPPREGHVLGSRSRIHLGMAPSLRLLRIAIPRVATNRTVGTGAAFLVMLGFLAGISGAEACEATHTP